MKKRILVFIPTFRCAQQIVRVLHQFDDKIQEKIDAVLIVDNRSPDNTFEVAQKTAQKIFKKIPFYLWINQKNYGLGGSHKVAFQFAKDNGFDYIIVLHGDDQAQIQDALPYLDQLENSEFFLGSRFMKGSLLKGYSPLRAFGNRVFNFLFSMVLNRKIFDLGSGLNIYHVGALSKINLLKFPDDLTFNYILLLSGYFHDIRTTFFPISWREEDQRSNVQLLHQSAKLMHIVLGYALFRKKYLSQELRTNPQDNYLSGDPNNTAIIITMAGRGTRFSDAGYTTPKHEIEVHGKSLFEWSLSSLREFFKSNHKLVFVCLREHSCADFIRRACLKMGLEHWEVLEINDVTDGQASSAYAAKSFWKAHDHLLIFNIDTHIHPQSLSPARIPPGSHGWVPTFKAPGSHWSFIKLDENNWATELAEKNRISVNASVGLYWFQRAEDFEKAYVEYFSNPANQVRGEKYVAPLYNYLIQKGAKISSTDIPFENVHVLGTPAELETFKNSKPRI